MTEGVCKSLGCNLIEIGALLIGKACAVAVLLGACQIDLLMGDIEITTKDDRFAELEIFTVLKEVSIPLLAIGESA